MASTYVNDLRLEEMATGDQSGTWGDTTNTNLELIAEAFSYGTEASFGSDADATTTIADGASDPARSLYLKITSGVSLTATRTLTIAPNTVSKVWIIENATSGSQSINISQGSGANVTIPNGDVKVVYSDGAGSGAAVVDAFTDLNLSGTTTVAALDAGSGAITTTGTVTGGTLAGTLSTAAQPNITSVGTLTGLTTTGDINLGDNDKAIFGAGSDLQIYHTGTESWIKDAGTGNFYIDSNGAAIQLTANNAAESMINAVPNGGITLFHDNAPKLATTSTGIDVTGTAVTDGLTVAGNVSIDGGTIKLDGNYPVGTDNVGIGNTALDSLTSGTGNIAVGDSTLTAVTSGTNNVGIGTDSLKTVSTGAGNVAVGFAALESNTASNNTAVGFTALLANTTGTFNAAVGYGALDANTTGANNTAVGYNALTANTTANRVTAVGTSALLANTTGENNTAIGVLALGANTTASNNTAVGDSALSLNTTGANNTAVGYEASRLNTSGNNNVSVGYQALEDNTTATGNTAVGLKALNANTTGSNNVGVGLDAGTNITTGSYNQIVGNGSGGTITTANGNVIIGHGSDVPLNTSSQSIVMGFQVTGVGTTNFTFGFQSNDSNIGFGATTITAPSDVRLKEDIQDEEVGLDFVKDLRPVTFRWKKAKDVPSELKAHSDSEERVMNGKYNHGFIAQEVKETIDKYNLKDGFDMWTEDEADGRQRIGEAALMPIMVKALQELSTTVDELKAEIQTLKGE